MKTNPTGTIPPEDILLALALWGAPIEGEVYDLKISKVPGKWPVIAEPDSSVDILLESYLTGKSVKWSDLRGAVDTEW